jgi:hypothetical protein
MVPYIQIKGNNLSRKKLSKGNNLIDQNSKTVKTTITIQNHPKENKKKQKGKG